MSNIGQTGNGNGVFTLKTTIGYAALQTAGLTNSAVIVTIPAKGVCLAAWVNVTVAFAGTSISALHGTVGSAASNAEYIASTSMLSTGASAGVAQATPVPENVGAGTAISLYVTAVGANLSALSAGSVDVYLVLTEPG